MWRKLKSVGSELRGLVSGWLVVALIAAAMTGFAPAPQASAEQALYSQIEAALCGQDQAHHAPDQHQAHEHDCTCCLPGAVVLQVAPLDQSASIPVTMPAQTVILEFAAWATPAHHPHETASGIPRGPPSFFI